jgi:hypothetical protein
MTERSLIRILNDLAACDARRRALITELKAAGYVRGRGLVGELGERLAAEYHGVPLAKWGMPGYDLIHKGRRVQVRSLRSTPENQRNRLGLLPNDYDVLLVLRFDEQYRVTYAAEVPRAVLDEVFPGVAARWTAAISGDQRTAKLPVGRFNRFLDGG